jgi:hypothetical protein
LKDGAGTLAPDELSSLQEIKEGIAAYVIGHNPKEIFDYDIC